jgi:GT2 family glycosyltransferase
MIGYARGSWIVFLDSDDELEPDHLARHRKAIEESPSVELWISPMRVVGHPLVPCARRPGQWVQIVHCIGVGMLAITRLSLLAVGGFPDLDYAEESVLISRLRATGIRQRRLHERTCVYHREHADAITRTRQLAG